MTIRDRIEQIGKSRGLNNATIEKETGLSNGQISKWATQKTSFDKIANVAKYLNVSVDWLITGKESADLTPEEQKLVDTYRNCNPVGRQLIQEQAESIREKLPADNIEQPAGVSTSAVG